MYPEDQNDDLGQSSESQEKDHQDDLINDAGEMMNDSVEPVKDKLPELNTNAGETISNEGSIQSSADKPENVELDDLHRNNWLIIGKNKDGKVVKNPIRKFGITEARAYKIASDLQKAWPEITDLDVTKL